MKYIALAIAVTAIFLALGNSDIQRTKTHKAMIEANYEQCPISLGDVRTIWVKDCVAYLETTERLEATK